MKKSIKLFVTAALLFSSTLSTYAQFESNRETSRFHFGLRAGVSSNTYNGDYSDYVEPFVAFTGGLAFDFQVAPVPVFIGFGLNYANLGMKFKKYSETQDANCFNLPLVVGYHFNVSPNFFISPYVGGSFSYCLDDLDDNNYDWDDNRFNYALRFGVGLNFGRLTFDVAYDLGLKNWADRGYSAHTGTLFATLGVNLAGKR